MKTKLMWLYVLLCSTLTLAAVHIEEPSGKKERDVRYLPSQMGITDAGPFEYKGIKDGRNIKLKVGNKNYHVSAGDMHMRNIITGLSIYAYCIDLHHTINGGAHYDVGAGVGSKQIYYIIQNNYPAVNNQSVYGLSAKEMAAAVQLAIWHYSDGLVLDAAHVYGYNYAGKLISAAGQIVADANQYAYNPPTLQIPSKIDILPALSNIQIGYEQNVEFTVKDQTGSTIANQGVHVTLSGVNTNSYNLTTESDGSCDIQLNSLQTGQTDISATAFYTFLRGLTFTRANSQTLVAATEGAGEEKHSNAFTWIENTTRAAIGDFVWADNNRNGLQDNGESGLSGVTVQLLDADGNELQSTSTNSNGAYRFDDVMIGEYKVAFFNLPADYQFSTKNTASNGNAVNPSTGETDVFSFSGEADNLTMDAGAFLNTGELRGYTWFDANENGLQDSNENVINNVLVSLFDTQNQLVAQTRTENGHYAFTEIPPISYQVQFTESPGGMLFTHQNAGDDTRDSDADAGGRTATVTVPAGNALQHVDAGYMWQKCKIGDFVWLDENLDGEYQDSEPGIPGVTVTVYDEYDNFIASAVTNDVGKYRIEGINPCNFYVTFSNIPGGFQFIQSAQSIDVSRNSDVNSNGVTPVVSIGPGQANMGCDAAIHPFNSRAIGGVWLDENENGLWDDGESGIPNVQTTLYDDNMQAMGSATTDDAGHYTHEQLYLGEYIVAVDKQTVPEQLQSTTRNTPSHFVIDNAGTEKAIDFGYAAPPASASGVDYRTLFAWYNKQEPVTLETTAQQTKLDDQSFVQPLYTTFGTNNEIDEQANYQEYDILQAWAAEVDLFIFDWHDAFSQDEKRQLIKLLDKTEWLNTTFHDQNFKFYIIASLHESTQAGLDACIEFLADSVVNHPAYYVTRDQFLGMQAYKRPVFISNKNQTLDAKQVRFYFEKTMPQDAQLVWNWDSDKINHNQAKPEEAVNFVDAFFPSFLQNAKDKSDDYLDEFYATYMFDRMDESIGAVWADPEETLTTSELPDEERPETLYDQTWKFAHENYPLWLLVNLWNDQDIYETDRTLMLTKNVLVRATRDHAQTWKGAKNIHAVSDEGLYCPYAILQARNAGVDTSIVIKAIGAYFSQNYEHALELLQREMNKIDAQLQNEQASILEIPNEFKLHNNYPNPFNAGTRIQFDLPEKSNVSIEIFNLRGEKVCTLCDAEMQAGTHHMQWQGMNDSGSQLPSGFYLCRMRAQDFHQTIKMMYAK